MREYILALLFATTGCGLNALYGYSLWLLNQIWGGMEDLNCGKQNTILADLEDLNILRILKEKKLGLPQFDMRSSKSFPNNLQQVEATISHQRKPEG